jgi:hypothetical protein
VIDKTKISIAIFVISAAMIFTTTATTIQSVSAASTTQGASTDAPGHLKTSEGDSHSARDLAPGIKARLPGGGCDVPSLAPGHLFRQEQTNNP